MATHYDGLLDTITFGKYLPFIEKAIELIRISPADKILDLGTGTGRSACLMRKYLSPKGKIIGIDISEEMTSQFQKKCANFSNVKIIKARVDCPLPFKTKFDKVFISFVLHGFPQNVREEIIKNVFEMLKESGVFVILDYNEFVLKEMPFYLRVPFRFIECPYAFDFIGKNWKKILATNGFGDFEEHIFFSYIRLLKARKILKNLDPN